MRHSLPATGDHVEPEPVGALEHALAFTAELAQPDEQVRVVGALQADPQPQRAVPDDVAVRGARQVIVSTPDRRSNELWPGTATGSSLSAPPRGSTLQGGPVQVRRRPVGFADHGHRVGAFIVDGHPHRCGAVPTVVRTLEEVVEECALGGDGVG